MQAPRVSIEPQWPMRIMALCSSIRRAGSPDHAAARGELWILLRDCLVVTVTQESRRFRGITHEDIQDLASNKALELVTRAERGDWDPTGRTTGEVVLYIRSTARRALMRQCDRQRGWTSFDDRIDEEVPVSGAAVMPNPPCPPPERSAEVQEFVRGLIECLSHLRERARTVWILRGIHDLSAREIAAHPKVGVSPGNVDVILMRVRSALRDCLGSKGFESGHVPAGSFTRIWLAMSGAESKPPAIVEEHPR